MKARRTFRTDKSFNIDRTKINDILQRRFVVAPDLYKDSFPEILRQHPLDWVSISNDQILALIFVSQADRKRINDYQLKNYLPFPGLYTTRPGTRAIFSMKGCRFSVVKDVTVKNAVAYSIGEDTSFIIINHCQILTTPDADTIQYTIPLAYVISFGDNITPETAYDHLDELIAYSVKFWRQSRG